MDTPALARFSTVAGSRESADAARDVRSLAARFYTAEGHSDLLDNSIPAVAIQSGSKLPDGATAPRSEAERIMTLTLGSGVDRLAITASTESVRFGIVLPVHNEEQLAPAALGALDRAISHVSGTSTAVGIVVVLDACTDRSSELVAAWRRQAMRTSPGLHIEIIETVVGNVGQARRMGFDALLRRWSEVARETIWLATTDADSEVPQNWISSQLMMRRDGGQVWAGAVSVRDWSGRVAGTAEAWRQRYEAECTPIHGANFGIGAPTYIEAGGFERLRSGEDRALFARTVALGAVIRHDHTVRVVTSSRRNARAPNGFAWAVTSVESMITTAAEQTESRGRETHVVHLGEPTRMTVIDDHEYPDPGSKHPALSGDPHPPLSGAGLPISKEEREHVERSPLA